MDESSIKFRNLIGSQFVVILSFSVPENDDSLVNWCLLCPKKIENAIRWLMNENENWKKKRKMTSSRLLLAGCNVCIVLVNAAAGGCLFYVGQFLFAFKSNRDGVVRLLRTTRCVVVMCVVMGCVFVCDVARLGNWLELVRVACFALLATLASQPTNHGGHHFWHSAKKEATNRREPTNQSVSLKWREM